MPDRPQAPEDGERDYQGRWERSAVPFDELDRYLERLAQEGYEAFPDYVPSSRIKQLVWNCIRAGIATPLPLPLNPPPILRLIELEGLLDDYRATPYCLRCSWSGDLDSERWGIRGVLCSFCLAGIEARDRAVRAELNLSDSATLPEVMIAALERAKSEPVQREIKRQLAATRAALIHSRTGRPRGSQGKERLRGLEIVRQLLVVDPEITDAEIRDELKRHGIDRSLGRVAIWRREAQQTS